MKNLKWIAAALFLSITVISCSDDDNNNNNNDLTCTEAAAETATAAQAYANATGGDLATKCVAYKAALNAQIDICGDASGALQLMVDSLGDCTVETSTGSITVNAGSSLRTFNMNITVTMNGTSRHIYAEDSAGYYIEFDLAEGATGAAALQNFNIHLISSDYNPLADDEGGNWTSNISVNTATEINGTFNGYVTSPTTGADIDLTSGVINLDL